MLTHTSATVLELLKDATTTLLVWMWNTFKAALTLLLLLLAWFAALGAWLNSAISIAAVGVAAFLLFLAVAPWLIPRLPIFQDR